MASAEDISHIDTLQGNSFCLQLKLTASDSAIWKYTVCYDKLHCHSLANHNTENYKVKIDMPYFIHTFLRRSNYFQKAEKVQFNFRVNKLRKRSSSSYNKLRRYRGREEV
jgi:hypothetical protein